MMNLPTKFELPTFPRYGDMKDVKNAQNGVIWGGWGSPKVIGNVTIQQSAFNFLFNFHRNYVFIYLVLFLTYNELFVEIRRLYPTPAAFGAPDGGDPVRISKRFLASEN